MVTGFSRLNDEEVFKQCQTYGANHYPRYDLIIRTAEGVWLFDVKNNRYLDCLAAYSAANQGHHHPRIVQAVAGALQNNYGSVLSNMVYTDVLGIFYEKLNKLLPQLAPRFGEHGNKILPKNGGVESVETAIKMMRYYGYKEKGITDGKQEIIVFENNFHGRMITEVSYSTTKKYKEGFGPLTPGFIAVEFGNIDAVRDAITDNTCGILVEPMQGEGGMYQPPDGFLKDLRELADEKDIILTFDEIQVGLGRTGKMFCFEHENVVPDGLILGKAISGGVIPLSVFAANSRLMDIAFNPGSDGSTYGGYPLACVAGCAALNVIVEEKLALRSEQMGAVLKKKIEEIASRSDKVKEVRGRGLFIGIELHDGDAMKYCKKLLDLGVLTNDSHGHTLRISPPLIITEEQIEYLVERLDEALVK
ncbi:MAG: aminotransferase class III-fold pyridoxal phosphate-dependent enzyme [candidate division Zixibacteria bacterium]|nr:aminotransferase class III-fold pyridoxal phosphate-dependent enzyme [candidate division Zixibacteria bacterium]